MGIKRYAVANIRGNGNMISLRCALPLNKGGASTLKIQNNADIRKRFGKINVARPIKGNSRKIEESPQGATTQIEADCETN